ncbi:hypothetical protein V498_01081 [Pseudogymnoascus sp. VKM F-4517 (FW-2822)]|nr:hypothetical protein V498_01081 [Pseudogymnoascus sp. VKM F-4517 (FW-2822)]
MAILQTSTQGQKQQFSQPARQSIRNPITPAQPSSAAYTVQAPYANATVSRRTDARNERIRGARSAYPVHARTSNAHPVLVPRRGEGRGIPSAMPRALATRCVEETD